MQPRTRAESSRCARSVFRKSSPLCACPTRPCCPIPVLCARSCGKGLCARLVVGSLGGFVRCAAGFTGDCTTYPAFAPLGPTWVLVLPACRGPKWCGQCLSGAGAGAGSCGGLFCGWRGVALAWGAVHLLAGLPWSLSHSWARSQLLRLWSPRESDRGLVGGGSGRGSWSPCAVGRSRTQ